MSQSKQGRTNAEARNPSINQIYILEGAAILISSTCIIAGFIFLMMQKDKKSSNDDYNYDDEDNDAYDENEKKAKEEAIKTSGVNLDVLQDFIREKKELTIVDGEKCVYSKILVEKPTLRSEEFYELANNKGVTLYDLEDLYVHNEGKLEIHIFLKCKIRSEGGNDVNGICCWVLYGKSRNGMKQIFYQKSLLETDKAKILETIGVDPIILRKNLTLENIVEYDIANCESTVDIHDRLEHRDDKIRVTSLRDVYIVKELDVDDENIEYTFVYIKCLHDESKKWIEYAIHDRNISDESTNKLHVYFRQIRGGKKSAKKKRK